MERQIKRAIRTLTLHAELTNSMNNDDSEKIIDLCTDLFVFSINSDFDVDQIIEISKRHALTESKVCKETDNEM